MFDGNDLLIAIKKASLDAIEASKPSDFCFGEVTSVSPLKITVEQRMTLSAAQLVLTRNVTDFDVKFTIGDETKEMTIHNSLKIGENLVLMKQKGGQKYLVLDRVVKA